MISVSKEARESAKKIGGYTLQVAIKSPGQKGTDFEHSRAITPSQRAKLVDLLMQWLEEEKP